MFCHAKSSTSANPSKFTLLGKASAPPPTPVQIMQLKQSIRDAKYTCGDAIIMFDLDTDHCDIRTGAINIVNLTSICTSTWIYVILATDRIVIVDQDNSYIDLRMSTSGDMYGYEVVGGLPETLILTLVK